MTHQGRVAVEPSASLSLEEKEILRIVEMFLAGIAKKDSLLLEEALDDEAEIQLLRQKRTIMGKKQYIKFVTVDAAPFYKSNFRFINVTVGVLIDTAVVEGKFVIGGLLFPPTLRLNLRKGHSGWRVKSNAFLD